MSVTGFTMSEREVEWLHFAVDSARRLRSKMTRLVAGSPDWAAENKRREDALESARRHAEQLNILRVPVPADLAIAMRAEGL